MAQMPPQINVYTEEDLRQLVETMRSTAQQTADYLANHAAVMRRRIEKKLRHEGMDEPRWAGNFGSTAHAAAVRAVDPMRKMIDDFENIAVRATALNRSYDKYYLIPLREVQAARKRDGSDMMRL